MVSNIDRESYIFLYSFVENIVVRKNLNKIEMIKEKKKK